jgi:dCTP deaminase
MDPDGLGVIIEPHGCLLAETVEWIRVPEDCLCLVTIKSTWARCFLNLNNTTLEPGWQGTITLELTNTSRLPIRVRPFHGIAQVVFLQGPPCTLPYNDRTEASYQDQRGPTPPRTRRPASTG